MNGVSWTRIEEAARLLGRELSLTPEYRAVVAATIQARGNPEINAAMDDLEEFAADLEERTARGDDVSDETMEAWDKAADELLKQKPYRDLVEAAGKLEETLDRVDEIMRQAMRQAVGPQIVPG